MEGTSNSTVNELDDLFQDVIEVEQSNQLVGESEAVNETNINPLINSFDLPSQQLQTFDSVFSLGGQEYFLNNCGSKRLVIGITSPSVPILKVIFRVHDLKNGWCIQFNKRTWDTIVQHETEIVDCMNHEVQTEIFDYNRIRAETRFLYNTCCVQFYDITETHVAMMPSTFERMMSLKGEVENIYVQLNKKINDVTKRFKLFMDLTFFQLFKSNNIDSRHNYNWLMLFMNDSPDFMDLNKSIANTWEQLGKWISNEQASTSVNET